MQGPHSPLDFTRRAEDDERIKREKAIASVGPTFNIRRQITEKFTEA